MTARSRSRRTAPRGAAYDLLHAVHVDDAYANIAMAQILAGARLDQRDAALATELAYGTLRGQGLYDAILSTCVNRPLDRLDGRLLDVLRMGTHQLVAMRVPPHAAVAESVALARDVAGEGPAKLANAVLRRVDEGGDLAAWVERLAPGDSVEDLALATSHPAWIVRALSQALSAHPPSPRADDASLRALLDADNAPARPTLVARPGRMDATTLCQTPGVAPARWSPYAAILQQGRPEDLAPVRDGRAAIQDEGSQLVALALAAVDVDGRDETWVDLCAGPGGKAALLAGLAEQRGSRVVAVEPHRHRAELVRRGMSDRHEVIIGDGREAIVAGRADRVLVDAPCTGLGALRRRPEARWRRTPADLAALGPLQRELLSAGAEAVRPGGVVAYATCSPHLAETDLVVDDVMRSRGDLDWIDARSFVPAGIPGLGEGPALRLWPHLHGTDGMYLALLRRHA